MSDNQKTLTAIVAVLASFVIGAVWASARENKCPEEQVEIGPACASNAQILEMMMIGLKGQGI